MRVWPLLAQAGRLQFFLNPDIRWKRDQCRVVVGGAAYRTRTCDPRITNAMLYQLS